MLPVTFLRPSLASVMADVFIVDQRSAFDAPEEPSDSKRGFLLGVRVSQQISEGYLEPCWEDNDAISLMNSSPRDGQPLLTHRRSSSSKMNAILSHAHSHQFPK